jgi:hypothetical protein
MNDPPQCSLFSPLIVSAHPWKSVDGVGGPGQGGTPGVHASHTRQPLLLLPLHHHLLLAILLKGVDNEN